MVLLECAYRMQSMMEKHRKHQGHPIVGYEEMMHELDHLSHNDELLEHDHDEELVEFTGVN